MIRSEKKKMKCSNEISHGNRNYVLLLLLMMKSVVVPYILGGKVPKATVLC